MIDIYTDVESENEICSWTDSERQREKERKLTKYIAGY